MLMAFSFSDTHAQEGHIEAVIIFFSLLLCGGGELMKKNVRD
jgi:hypothetical protein